jgi:hypothetical protein
MFLEFKQRHYDLLYSETSPINKQCRYFPDKDKENLINLNKDDLYQYDQSKCDNRSNQKTDSDRRRRKPRGSEE